MHRTHPTTLVEASSMGVDVVHALGKLEKKIRTLRSTAEKALSSYKKDYPGVTTKRFEEYIDILGDAIARVAKLNASDFTSGKLVATRGELESVASEIDERPFEKVVADAAMRSHELAYIRGEPENSSAYDEGTALFKQADKIRLLDRQRVPVEDDIFELNRLLQRVMGRNTPEAQRFWNEMMRTLKTILASPDEPMNNLWGFGLTREMVYKFDLSKWEKAYDSLKKVNPALATPKDVARAFGSVLTATGRFSGMFGKMVHHMRSLKNKTRMPMWHVWANHLDDFVDSHLGQ